METTRTSCQTESLYGSISLKRAPICNGWLGQLVYACASFASKLLCYLNFNILLDLSQEQPHSDNKMISYVCCKVRCRPRKRRGGRTASPKGGMCEKAGGWAPECPSLHNDLKIPTAGADGELYR